MAHEAFNHLMRQFLDELQACFPDEEAVRTLVGRFELGCRADITAPFKVFHSFLEDRLAAVVKRDESLVTDLAEAMPGLEKVWEKADEETRDIIWEYIFSLTVVATGMEILEAAGEDPELLKNLLVNQ